MKKIMFNDRYGLTQAVLDGRKTQTRRIAYMPFMAFDGEFFRLLGKVIFEKGCHNKKFVKADLMPHRIRITNIRVERLQDISEEDCLEEGIWRDDNVGLEGTTYWYYGLAYSSFRTAKEAYAAMIDKISGKGTWESNPWVFVYDFELAK